MTRIRAVRARPLWLAGLIALACTEGTGPEALGVLRLRAVFAPGEEPSALGVAVNDIRIVVHRTGGAAAIDTTMPFEAGATLSWILDLSNPPEAFEITAELGAATLALYAGSGQASVAEGITATPGAVTDVPVRFLGKPVTSLEVTPGTAGVQSLGARQQFTAVARDAQGTVVPGVAFTWSSSNAAVASVDTAGLATGLAVGTTTITASTAGLSASATLVVTQVPASVAVQPDSATLEVGQQLVLTATARDANGHLIPGMTFTWSSRDSSIAGVTAVEPDTGLLEAVSIGRTIVVGAIGGVTDSVVVTVLQDDGPGSPVAFIEVSPPIATITALGNRQQFTAVARSAKGTVIPGVKFAWSSAYLTVASIDSTGLATAHGGGITTITASANGLSGTAILYVTPLATSIRVTPPSAIVAKGDSVTFSAVALDANGNTIPGAQFVWFSSNPAVAAVGAATGRATGLASGTVLVTASFGGVSASATLEVVEVGQVTVQPGGESVISVNQTIQFTAVVKDVNGKVVTGLQVTWSSTDPSTVPIDPISGLARGLKRGWADIHARVGNVTGIAFLVVR